MRINHDDTLKIISGFKCISYVSTEKHTSKLIFDKGKTDQSHIIIWKKNETIVQM